MISHNEVLKAISSLRVGSTRITLVGTERVILTIGWKTYSIPESVLQENISRDDLHKKELRDIVIEVFLRFGDCDVKPVSTDCRPKVERRMQAEIKSWSKMSEEELDYHSMPGEYFFRKAILREKPDLVLRHQYNKSSSYVVKLDTGQLVLVVLGKRDIPVYLMNGRYEIVAYIRMHEGYLYVEWLYGINRADILGQEHLRRLYVEVIRLRKYWWEKKIVTPRKRATSHMRSKSKTRVQAKRRTHIGKTRR